MSLAPFPEVLIFQNNGSVSFLTAVAEWRECWDQHQNDTLNAVAVHTKYHTLLTATTGLYGATTHHIERHNLTFGRHKYPQLKDTCRAFDVAINVSVKFEALVDEDTLENDNNETGVIRATEDTPCVTSIVYVQKQQPKEPIRTNAHHRLRMQAPVFSDFQRELQAVVDECFAGHASTMDYRASSDGAGLVQAYWLMMEVLMDLQNIRPYIIDLSGEYLERCLSVDRAVTQRCQTEIPILVEVPEGIRRMAPHVTDMCVHSGYAVRFPEWFGEFTALKVLRLGGSSRERDYLPVRFTRYSNQNLRELPNSLWQMKDLETLELSLFVNLTTLPDSMTAMTSLTTLVFRNMFERNEGCMPGSISTLPALAHLSVSEIWRSDMPAFLTAPHLPLLGLKELDIFECSFLEALPDDFAMFPALEQLNVYNMGDLRTLPPSMSCLKRLKFLRLDELAKFGTGPEADSGGSNDESDGDENENDDEDMHDVDEETDMDEETDVDEETDAMHSYATHPRKSDRATAESDDDDSEEDENVHQKHELIFGGLTALEELHINDIENMRALPQSVADLQSLRRLCVSSVPIRHLDDIIVLSSLTALEVSHLEDLTHMPAQMNQMRGLTTLSLVGLEIPTLPDSLCELTNLQTLHIKNMDNMFRLPANLMALVALQELLLQSCRLLTELPRHWNCMTSLRILKISSVPRIEQLPLWIARATQLQELQLSGSIGILRNDTDTLHIIGELTNLTCLTLGPWDGTNFPASLRRLVKMKALDLHVESDATRELRDPNVFRKIAWALSCMPALEKLKITHGTYAPEHSILFDTDQYKVSVTLLSLRAHPRVELQSFQMMHSHGNAPLHMIPHRRDASSVLIRSYIEECEFPLRFANLSDEEIMAEWRLSLEKILAFMQGTHRRLGSSAPCATLLAELFTQIAEYTVFRSEFDHVMRGIADL